MNNPNTWKGSQSTYNMVNNMVKQQILQRFGQEAADKYQPLKNCFTYNDWIRKGYHVKKGEKALKSVTFLEYKDKDTNEIKKRLKGVSLFYQSQVEKMTDIERDKALKRLNEVIKRFERRKV